MTGHGIKQFLLPRFDRRYIIRILIVTLVAVIIFKYILIPFRIQGNSMWPTYSDGSVNLCYTPRYLFSEPGRYDIVTIELAGHRVMLLKRIVALENEIVAFHNGRLYVNGQMIDEPYISDPADWNLPPRQVKPGHVYVVGDNRSVPQEQHDFGQVPVRRINGAPLFGSDLRN